MKTVRLTAIAVLCGTISLFAQEQSSDSLNLKTNYLDEVVLLDARIPLKRSQSGKPVLRIDEKQLEAFNGRSLSELLATQAGIEVIGSRLITGQNLRFAIRGSANNQVLILVDGIRVADPSRIGNDFDLNFLSLDQISEIEILKGGASTLYGSAAAAAVVNITTKKVSEKGRLALGFYTGTEQSQNQSIDDLNYLSNTLQYAGKTKSLFYKLGYSGLKTNGMSAVESGTEIDPFNRYTINAQLGGKHQQFDWYVQASKAKIENDYDNVFPIEDADFSAISTFENIAFQAKYNYGLGELSLTTGMQNTDREYRDNYPAQYTAYNRTFELVNRLQFSKNLYSVQGYLRQQASYEERPALAQNDLFVNLVYVSDNGINFNAGIRRNDHETYGEHFTYSVNPSYSFQINAHQLKLFASYNTAFIAPSLFQLYDTYSGNVDLAPEESQSLEVGTTWVKGDGRATLAFFQRREDPKIVYDFTTYAYANAPSDVKFRGVELSYINRLFQVLDFNVNYTFTQLKNGELVRLPKHAVDSSVNYAFANKSNLGVYYTYRGERQAVDLTTLDAYGLIDLRYAKRFYNDKMTASVWFSNLFDTDYVEITNFSTKGRNLRIGLAFQF
ncbi:MAG: TonB-dependent receptor plug domain-containing protein [Flavobacteriaceae bacterium]